MLIQRGARMSWRRVAKSLQALVAHGLLFSFTLLLVLKLDHALSYSWWFVLYLPIVFFFSFFWYYCCFLCSCFKYLRK
uniref:Uncharacterized protein LOC8269523 n=1 Tax=Rhizophora mucronata TaxID=61149 RepID=A0A2P2L997_RHIMU